jgi:hypothetical protein
LSSLNKEASLQLANVNSFKIHQDWNPTAENYDADIALAILGRTISFNNFVQPICLWTFTTSYEDLIWKQAIIAGWGQTGKIACKPVIESFISKTRNI